MTSSPTLTVIVTSHFLAISKESTLLPAWINAPDSFSSAFSGRSIPSKIFLKIPGPNVAQIGEPVETTGSPGLRPVVVSYTWMVVNSLEIEITSPINESLPTYTISNMEKDTVSFTFTTGPLIE